MLSTVTALCKQAGEEIAAKSGADSEQVRLLPIMTLKHVDQMRHVQPHVLTRCLADSPIRCLTLSYMLGNKPCCTTVLDSSLPVAGTRH